MDKRGSITRVVLFGLLTEVAVVLAVTGLVAIWQPMMAKSGFLGALAYLIPNTYFAVNAFRHIHASLEVWIVRSFYRGQTGKLALSALAFALVFHFHRDVHYGALFLGFILMILVSILVTKRIAAELTSSLVGRQGTH